MKIGQRIKKMRELKNFTQGYVAEKIGISQAAYSDIEKDKTDVSMSRLEQIATVLEVTPTNILTFDEKIVFNVQENKGLANIFKNTTDTAIIDRIEAATQNRITELKALYEDRLADKDKEIARLSTLLEKVLSK